VRVSYADSRNASKYVFAFSIDKLVDNFVQSCGILKCLIFI
jgi:hypothetical protein